MARNTNGAGFSLKDDLFNAETMRDLAREYAGGVAGFDAEAFHQEVTAGLQGRELLERLEWIADCIEPRLARDFPTMADQIEAAMPPPLDPTLRDDDFGRFIHSVPGILAVRHGLESHPDRALDLLHAATQRFSMEFYIRPFLNRWPERTMARLWLWAEDENYHVRRLVSEGTRPRLPWARRIDLDPLDPLPFLDHLHGDPTRYVTRSVANHLNDIAKIAPEAVVTTLTRWQNEGRQQDRELGWMTRHACRTLVKQGHAGALKLLGFRADAPIRLERLELVAGRVPIGGALEFEVELTAPEATPVVVDYQLWLKKANGALAPKVFKLKQAKIPKGKPLTLQKRHPLKGDASTFRLHAGVQKLVVQVNGKPLGEVGFELTNPA